MTEIHQLYESLVTTINCLFQMSVLARKPARHDFLTSQQFIEEDINLEGHHRVSLKATFPQADDAIIKRMTSAMTRRRKYLNYRRHRHSESSHGYTPEAKRNVVTFVSHQRENPVFEEETSECESQSESGSGSCESESTSSRLSFALVPPQGFARGKSFTCPCCYSSIAPPNHRSWRKHIFCDIRPYMCTVPACPSPYSLFPKRREWIHHMQYMHAEDWPGIERETDSDTAKLEIRPEPCPLCKIPMWHGKHYQRHLASHLETIALSIVVDLDWETLPFCRTMANDDKAVDPVNTGTLISSAADAGKTDFTSEALERTAKKEKLQLTSLKYISEPSASKREQEYGKQEDLVVDQHSSVPTLEKPPSAQISFLDRYDNLSPNKRAIIPAPWNTIGAQYPSIPKFEGPFSTQPSLINPSDTLSSDNTIIPRSQYVVRAFCDDVDSAPPIPRQIPSKAQRAIPLDVRRFCENDDQLMTSDQVKYSGNPGRAIKDQGHSSGTGAPQFAIKSAHSKGRRSVHQPLSHDWYNPSYNEPHGPSLDMEDHRRNRDLYARDYPPLPRSVPPTLMTCLTDRRYIASKLITMLLASLRNLQLTPTILHGVGVLLSPADRRRLKQAPIPQALQTMLRPLPRLLVTCMVHLAHRRATLHQ